MEVLAIILVLYSLIDSLDNDVVCVVGVFIAILVILNSDYLT